MKATKTQKQFTVTLELNEDEARFVKDLVQNYMGDNPANEPPEHNNMRCVIFHAIADCLDR